MKMKRDRTYRRHYQTRTRISIGQAIVVAVAGLSLSGTVGCAPEAAARDQAVTTQVMVRAVSRDAKVIGDGVGGAHITIRNAETGEVLAEGTQSGGTGSTDAIMREPRARGTTAFGVDPEAAGFLASLSLAEPTRVEIIAEGPLGTPHARQRTSKTILLVPGYDLLGEGIILELNGFRVELLEPVPEQELVAGSTLDIRTKVTMMCGCPTEPDGLWNSNDYELFARLLRDGNVVQETSLVFSGETSVFEGSLPLESPGELTLEVFAIDVEKGNTGMMRRDVTIAG
jgi:hypothetical protein